jgi:alkylresorcinol/alkylpyrone synthase
MSQVHWLSCATGNPPIFFTQERLFEMAGYGAIGPEEERRARLLFRGAGVARRSMWLSENDHRPSSDPDDFHARYVSGLREVVPRVAREALARAGVAAGDLDFVVFASCTGYTCPGFSVELAELLGVPEDRPTANLLGMGCSAFVPALARAHDHLAARSGRRALVVAAEICSATYWIDGEMETAVGNALFGDGVAAAVLSTEPGDLARARGPVAAIEGFRTLRDGRHLGDMGFTQSEGRLRVRLAREIPDRILPLVLRMVKTLELEPGSRVAFHPGGRKILDGLATGLAALSPAWAEPISWSRGVMKDYGNMSSPTVAFVLERSFERRALNAEGESGALVTMGPGLSVEGVRLKWRPPA